MKIVHIAALALLVAAQAAFAAELGPDALVRQVTEDVMNSIHHDKALQAGDRKKALALAEQKILPHVDFETMTRYALGRNWRKATPAQRKHLVNAFRGMLIQTYANQIGTYRGQKMVVKPTRLAPGDTDATVRNSFVSPGRPPVEIDYSMEKTPQGWMIYDVVIDGVSLLATYRSQFAQQVRAGGIEGLIARLDQLSSGAGDSKSK